MQFIIKRFNYKLQLYTKFNIQYVTNRRDQINTGFTLIVIKAFHSTLSNFLWYVLYSYLSILANMLVKVMLID